MKLFDIALSYLDYDFKGVDIYNQKKAEEQLKKIFQRELILKKYLLDERVKPKKEDYTKIVFVAALHHKMDKAHRKPSFYDVVFEIYDAHKSVLTKKFEKYKATYYPAIMFKGWNKYVEDVKHKPYYFLDYELCSSLFISLFDYFSEL